MAESASIPLAVPLAVVDTGARNEPEQYLNNLGLGSAQERSDLSWMVRRAEARKERLVLAVYEGRNKVAALTAKAEALQVQVEKDKRELDLEFGDSTKLVDEYRPEQGLQNRVQPPDWITLQSSPSSVRRANDRALLPANWGIDYLHRGSQQVKLVRQISNSGKGFWVGETIVTTEGDARLAEVEKEREKKWQKEDDKEIETLTSWGAQPRITRHPRAWCGIIEEAWHFVRTGGIITPALPCTPWSWVKVLSNEARQQKLQPYELVGPSLHCPAPRRVEVDFVKLRQECLHDRLRPENRRELCDQDVEEGREAEYCEDDEGFLWGKSLDDDPFTQKPATCWPQPSRRWPQTGAVVPLQVRLKILHVYIPRHQDQLTQLEVRCRHGIPWYVWSPETGVWILRKF